MARCDSDWSNHLHTLRTLKEVKGNLDPILVRGISPEGLQEFRTLEAAVIEVALFCTSYLSAPLEAGLDSCGEPQVGPPVSPRKSWIVSAIAATSLAAALEGFVGAVGDRWVGTGELRRLRTTAWGSDLPPDDPAARLHVLSKLRPSQKKGGEQWLRRVNDAFGLAVPIVVGDALASMIGWRNKFVHGPRPQADADYQPPNADEVESWVRAIELFSRDLVEATSAAHPQN